MFYFQKREQQHEKNDYGFAEFTEGTGYRD